MTRYALDTAAFLAVVRAGTQPGDHQLVGAGDLRSAALAILYHEHRDGRLADAELPALLDALTAVKVRLLGDRVSRSVAWRIAEELGLDDVREAEVLAVARLQADALIALDPRIRSLAEGVVPVAGIEQLGVA